MSQASLNPLRALLIWLVATLILGAFFAPQLFFLGQWGLEILPESYWLRNEIDKASFSRYFNRSLLIVALLGAWPLIRALKVPGLSALGIQFSPGWWKELLLGFLLALIPLLLMGFSFLYLSDGEIYRYRKSTPWGAVQDPIISGIAVALVEEFFFRGILLIALVRTLGILKGTVITTIFFALVHFLKPPASAEIPLDEVSFLSGFQVLGSILTHFGNANFLLAEMATLLAVGSVLALARWRTGKIWASVGLHAGWVFGLKYFSAITTTSGMVRRGETLPWIGENLKIGLAPFLIVLATGGIVALIWRHWILETKLSDQTKIPNETD